MIEDAISRGMLKNDTEKTFIDKLLAKEDVDRIRGIIKKPKLERVDILEILYLLSGAEAKLVNYNEHDRYVILKLFVWIRDFVKAAELLYDYVDRLEQKKVKLDVPTQRILDNCKRLIEHNVKFLVDLYLNIARTSLSLGATGFMEIIKQKFELSYKGGVGAPQDVGEAGKVRG